MNEPAPPEPPEPSPVSPLDTTVPLACRMQAAADAPTVLLQPNELRHRGNEATGWRIGPYRLLELLGEGGFGSVWRAEQQEPIRREVALKVIKAGMDSREIIARFEAERQALALMDHPNIAAVLDAGTAENGRPFFAMELVKGVPITAYCDAHRLGVRERLELFIPVCQAVQHAHQKAILHRDLKPSNILVMEVDGRPVPKVIDFGIAKALHVTAGPALHATLAQTIEGMIVGTPQYMSPEQAGSVPDVDTRSDIYTLGVILHELLVGETPLSRGQLNQAALDEVLRLIRESEARRPSSRCLPATEVARTTASLRHTEPRKLGQSLRGDLDWIVLKALEKDRTRRYETANALALDLRRHLDDEPVSAGPPSAGYRLKKLVRRNRGAVAAASAVVFCLVAGIIGTGLALAREREALRREKQIRQLAQHAQGTAETIINSMLHDLRDKLKPLGRLDLLDDVSKEAESYFAGLPVEQKTPTVLYRESVMMRNRSDVLVGLGKLPEARVALEKALAQADKLMLLEPDNAQWQAGLAENLDRLGLLAQLEGNLAAAESAFKRAQEVGDRPADKALESPDLSRNQTVSLRREGQVAHDRGDLAGACAAFEKTLESALLLLDKAPSSLALQRDVATGHLDLGDVLQELGDLKAARSHFEKALSTLRGLGASDPGNVVWLRETSLALHRLGLVAIDFADLSTARQAYEETLGLRERLVSRDASNMLWQEDLARICCELGHFELDQGNFDASRKLFSRALDITAMLQKQDETNMVWADLRSVAQFKSAVLARTEGQLEQAQSAYEESLATMSRMVEKSPRPDWKRSQGLCWKGIGGILFDRGLFKEARASYMKGLEIIGPLSFESPGNIAIQWDLAVGHVDLGDVSRAEGNSEEAQSSYAKALAIYEKLSAADPADRRWIREKALCHNRLGSAFLRLGNPQEAKPHYERALTMRQGLADIAPGNLTYMNDLGWSQLGLGECLLELGDAAAAFTACSTSAATARRLVQTRIYPSEAAGLLAFACLKQVEAGLKKTPQETTTRLRSILEEALSVLESVRVAGKLNTNEMRIMEQVRRQLDGLD